MTLSFPVTERDHIQGGKAAGVALVEYGDYECSSCALAHPVFFINGQRYSRSHDYGALRTAVEAARA